MRHVLLRGDRRPIFFVKTWDAGRARLVTLAALRCQADGQVETLWKLGGLPETRRAAGISAEETGLEGDASALLRVRLAAHQSAGLAGDHVQPRIVENQPLGVDISPPIVAELHAGEGRCVIAEGPGQQVFAIVPPSPARR